MPRPARADRIAKSAERRLALVIAASCLAGCIGGMPIALDAWRSEVIIAAMQSGSASARGDVLERFADIAPGTLPDRAEAALAQIALAEAGDTHEQDLRQLCLARASQLIGHLRFVRPIWAPSLILSTELAVAAEAPNAPVAGQALADYAAEVGQRRAQGLPTVPAPLGRELATNPFLRADDPALQARWGGGDAVATFAALRSAKDTFR